MKQSEPRYKIWCSLSRCSAGWVQKIHPCDCGVSGWIKAIRQGAHKFSIRHYNITGRMKHSCQDHDQMLHLAWVLNFHLRPLTKQLGGRRVLRPTESQITSTYQNVWWCDGSVQHAGTVLFLPKEPYLGTCKQYSVRKVLYSTIPP